MKKILKWTGWVVGIIISLLVVAVLGIRQPRKDALARLSTPNR